MARPVSTHLRPSTPWCSRLRLPRTLLGLLVGAALGLAGALMQALTRNPLADPGLLGVNAGAVRRASSSPSASSASTSLGGYVWFAFAGAAVGARWLVYAVGGGRRRHPGEAGPGRRRHHRACSYALRQRGDAARRPAALDQLPVLDGRLAGRRRHSTTVGTVAPVHRWPARCSRWLLARPLNALALGDDAARALGAHLGRARVLACVAASSCCAARRPRPAARSSSSA